MTKLSPVSSVADYLAGMLMSTPAAVLSDFDGTLSAMAPTPDSAVLAPGAADALRALHSRVGLVGIVTGRGIDDVMGKIGIPDLLYVGNHGLEAYEGGEHSVHPAGLAAEQALPDALREIQQSLAARISLDGVIFENKRYSASIHYRQAGDPIHTGDVLTPILDAVASEFGFWVSDGKMVQELRPGEAINKGTAVRNLVQSHGLRSVVFFGDDVTDADAFVVLREIREAQGIATCSVGVLTPDTHPRVIENSDFLLDGFDDVVAVLAELATRLPEGDIDEEGDLA